MDGSVESVITNLMVNRTIAFTGGRDGHDSKCWFFKDRLFRTFGPITDYKFEVEIILRKNMHKLAENAVGLDDNLKGFIEI